MSKNNQTPSDTADILIEIGCEELPAAELYQLIDDFASQIEADLEKAQLTFKEINKFATPRRLALVVRKLQTSQKDREIDRRGPSVKAAYQEDDKSKPTQAAIGFAQSCGIEVEKLTSISTDKGEYLSAKVTINGLHINQLLPSMLNSIIPKLTTGRTMRWDDTLINATSSTNFVRPVRWLLALVDQQILEWEMFGLRAGNESYGHRFMNEYSGDKPIKIKHADDYEDVLLKQGNVIADIAKRKEMISQSVEGLSKKAGYSVSEKFTDDLLDELAAITEFPVGYLGEFDKEYLKLPNEVLESVLIKSQRYIPLMDASVDASVDISAKMSPKFIFIANIDSKDAQLLIEGNQAVVRPRLADASFFYQQDLSKTLESRLEQLEKVTFVQQLGSVENKAYCCHDLAKYLVEELQWQDVGKAATLAARLSKCDLTTLMVQEFTELQGVMGKYYLLEDYAQGKLGKYSQADVDKAAIAIEEHYLPRFAGDKIASSRTGKLASIADRIDTLVGLFHAGYKPTSEKDPYALRRTALGLVRTIIESELHIDLAELAKQSVKCYKKHNDLDIENSQVEEVINFINERVYAYGREKNIASDVLDAVFYSPQNDLYDAWLRVQVLKNNLSSQVNSLIGINKRLKNLLSKQLEQSGKALEINEELFESESEKQVFAILQENQQDFDQACASRKYADCLNLLSGLSSPLEEFFSQVMVMVDDKKIRENRLLLLNKIHQSFLRIADFSRLIS